MSSILLLLLSSHLALAAPVNIVVMGDSITEGYGIDQKNAYPALLEAEVHNAGFSEVKILNAGISGSTSASGLGRLQWHLKQKFQILVLSLGVNDGMRGTPPDQTYQNLSKVIELAKQNGIRVLLTGQKVPPSFGKKHSIDFAAIYPKLAKKFRVRLVPFMLEGVGGERSKNIPDGIHPNEAGQRIVTQNILPHLLKILKDPSP